MSLNVVREQIGRFLESAEPEVMAIKGAWGVGKTYTWHTLLLDARRNDKIALDTYSYISLFGVQSLDSLKYAIFEQAVNKNIIGQAPSIESFKSNAAKLVSSLSKKSLIYFNAAPVIKNFAPAIQSASFLSVNKSVVCIDDFERKSDSVSLRDILGLVLQLKEQRSCKVVLIFNDQTMGSENNEEYQKFREKVIDFEIEFNPTSRECVEIAIPNPAESKQVLVEHIEKLGISNIRIIKKIERLFDQFMTHLAGFEKEVTHQAAHTLCLYALCFYSTKPEVPKYDYVKNIGYRLLGFDEQEDQTDQERSWNAFLREYGYQHADEFDLQIAAAVEKGYIERVALAQEAGKLNSQIVAAKSESSFSSAWDLYHNSFENNTEEVLNALRASFEVNAKVISPLNLNGTVRLFRELGEDGQADDLIEIYVSAHEGNPQIFDLNAYGFAGEITDEAIRERFSTIAESNKAPKSVRDVLADISSRNGWNEEDEKVLADATAEEFLDVFKSEQGGNLSRYVNASLRFGKFSNSSEQQQKIAENATQALRIIARESLINKMRVRKYGVQLDNVLDDEGNIA
ncbi:P-loop NTPase fold protein [Thiorhodococcus minor]|uniref:KAP NTPase domain-containing protein n=1 Tax=Thiorhodococcus minor TaxID=57489 RepID=A0A6M0K819_9GAMM|nr:P-loop NTPase fold protein [Thiorhodococcus minor]NEV65123.1 hypothetical protein [Thiorhodococcus minor]